MKSIILIAALILAGNVVVFSQCNKQVILTSSLTEYLDSNDVVERSVPEKTIIKIDKSTLSIAPGDDHEMTGTINENKCDWSVPYKAGKSIIKATMTDEGGDKKNATLTIQGKDGKVTLVMQIAEMPGKKIRVNIDTFGQAK